MEKKLELLKETILLGESLLTEAKKIGIDKLPYGYDSLTRFIDEKTMDVHYNKHYKGYVKKLNDALSKKDYGNVELEDIIKSITRFPKTIRNNGGGAYNHSLFWKMLSPEKQNIKGEILTKINKEFGSYNNFKKEFTEKAMDRFGSGWAWLVLTPNNRLKIMTTPNQDNPQMNDIDGGGFPLLGLDLWEHAYYLEYQNKRDEYIKKFWDVVNWEYVNEVFRSKLKSKLKESVTSKKVITEQVEPLLDNGRVNYKFVQKMLKAVYPKCSPEIITNYSPDKHIESPCYGKIETNDCKTNFGVIGGKYAVSQRGGVGEWSVVNWFDANTKISDKILEFYKKYNKYNLDFGTWMDRMKNLLFGENGNFIETLANIIMNPTTKKGTLDFGSAREKLAIDILNTEYNDSSILRYCDGDVRDKYKGQDMLFTNDGIDQHIQVKPTRDLYETTIDGKLTYVFKSKNNYKPENIQIFAFVDNENNYVFFDFNDVKIEDEGQQSLQRYSYIFDGDSIMIKSPSLRLNKLVTESKGKKTILITETQLKKIMLEQDSTVPLVQRLCNQRTLMNHMIYCKLSEVRNGLGDENLKNEFDVYFSKIFNFFNRRNTLNFRKVIRLMLMHSNETFNILKTLGEFIDENLYTDTPSENESDEYKKIKKEVKNKLIKVSEKEDIKINELDTLLRAISELKHSKYEKSLVGPYMEKFSTMIRLDFSCDEIDEKSFKDIVKNVKKGSKQLDIVVNTLFKCIIDNMSTAKPIKADLRATSDYFYNKNVIFPQGSNFEVKMMDTETDSSLSEFFSIFKQSETIKELKETHLDVYNEIINKLYKKLKTSPIAQQFLKYIKDNLAAVIFSNNVIVPMEYITIYWSDKGQRTCTERRLSVRFKINDKNVISYIYNKDSNELILNTEPINVQDFKEINCS